MCIYVFFPSLNRRLPTQTANKNPERSARMALCEEILSLNIVFWTDFFFWVSATRVLFQHEHLPKSSFPCPPCKLHVEESRQAWFQCMRSGWKGFQLISKRQSYKQGSWNNLWEGDRETHFWRGSVHGSKGHLPHNFKGSKTGPKVVIFLKRVFFHNPFCRTPGYL